MHFSKNRYGRRLNKLQRAQIKHVAAQEAKLAMNTLKAHRQLVSDIDLERTRLRSMLSKMNPQPVALVEQLATLETRYADLSKKSHLAERMMMR